MKSELVGITAYITLMLMPVLCLACVGTLGALGKHQEAGTWAIAAALWYIAAQLYAKREGERR